VVNNKFTKEYFYIDHPILHKKRITNSLKIT
jgi:hypothetical protein